MISYKVKSALVQGLFRFPSLFGGNFKSSIKSYMFPSSSGKVTGIFGTSEPITETSVSPRRFLSLLAVNFSVFASFICSFRGVENKWLKFSIILGSLA